MPVSWVNQIKHPEPLYLYSTYSMVHIATWSIHVFYFSTVYTIPVSRRFVPVGYTVHFKQYSQMFYQQNIFCSYVTRGNNKCAGPMFKQYKMNSNLSFHVFLRPSYDSFFHWPQIFQFWLLLYSTDICMNSWATTQ